MTNRRARPFRFQATWFKHDDYPEVVQDAWIKNNGYMVVVLKNVVEVSKQLI
uniref:Uncharacterized protein n=1 Tax=Cajanus cajan TaxID=3821 RepID=A0A151RDG3_CAJCA|nr:hypothetical protein KK1_038165 [Cajanus cajan]